MTSPTPTSSTVDYAGLPAPDTPALLTRPLRPGVDRRTLARFSADRWDLTPGLFEDHTAALGINFDHAPAAFRAMAKHYTWQLINCETPPVLSGPNGRRLALRTIGNSFGAVTAFLHWLDAGGITTLARVTHTDLDDYLADLLAADRKHEPFRDRVLAVRRLWVWRSLLPAEDRLPEAPPWQGQDTGTLCHRRARHTENRTPRIPPATMDRLLLWSLRFVDTFAPDLLALREEFTTLAARSFAVRLRRDRQPLDRTPARFHTELAELLGQFERTGIELAGALGADGPVLDYEHLGRLLDCPTHWLRRPENRPLLQGCGLPIADAAYLHTPVRAQLDGQPWLARVPYHDAGHLLRHLATASALVTLYLSGMRPGEALTLRRGCVRHDPVTHLWLVHGTKWKGAVDATGAKRAEGQQRDDPWVVVKPVADAVAVLEALHDEPLLLPTTIVPTPQGTTLAQRRHGKARTTRTLTNDIQRFVTWVNNYCAEHRRDDEIPLDSAEMSLCPSRLRRTLAWHIVRRPRGLIAGAIQYGHVHVGVTLGYSGTYASGFPDEHAFETWLLRLDQLAEADQRLRAGEHVSGPAAAIYTQRVQTGNQRFVGRVLTTGRQARDLLANPTLHIHPGTGMTCVFDPDKAQCRLRDGPPDVRATPDLTDCRPSCQNIARTDRDIDHLRHKITELEALVNDPLAPAPRSERERHELARLQTITADHDHTNPETTP